MSKFEKDLGISLYLKDKEDHLMEISMRYLMNFTDEIYRQNNKKIIMLYTFVEVKIRNCAQIDRS